MPVAGELVTETFEYDGGRQVTVYVPAARPEAVVFAGDDEYSPGFDPERFSAHERFFREDVGQWARSRFGVALPAERTAVCGVSAGGELALPFFLRNAIRWAHALRDAGADVVLNERVGPHGGAFWREEFALMVAWAFGR